MVKEGRPRRGSLGFVRKRARKIVPRVRSWPRSYGKGLLGFAGFKVGMATVIGEVTNPYSRLKGQEVAKAATFIEVPPLKVVSARVYKKTTYGLKAVGEYHSADEIPENLDGTEVRLICEVQADKAGLPKKKHDIIEIALGGSFEDQLAYAKEKLGKEIDIEEVLKPGDLIDVIAVTKGKGLAGVVKRFGVKMLSHKAEKSRRKVGSLGPWTPKRTPWQVPMAGQLGFQVRTELNKEVLLIGDGKDFNPAGGWHRYGLMKSKFILVSGSIPGAIKRVIRIRKAIRPPKNHYPFKVKKVIL